MFARRHFSALRVRDLAALLFLGLVWHAIPAALAQKAGTSCLDLVPGESFALIHVRVDELVKSPWFKLLPKDAQDELEKSSPVPGFPGRAAEVVMVYSSPRFFGFGFGGGPGFKTVGSVIGSSGVDTLPPPKTCPPPKCEEDDCGPKEEKGKKDDPDDRDDEFSPLTIFRTDKKIEGLKGEAKKGPLGGTVHRLDHGVVLVLPDGMHGVWATTPGTLKRLEKTKGELATVAKQLKEQRHHVAIGIAPSEKNRAELKQELGDPRGFAPDFFLRRLMLPFTELRWGHVTLHADKQLTVKALGHFTSKEAAKTGKLATEDAIALLRIMGLGEMERDLFFMRDRALTDQQELEVAHLEALLDAAYTALRGAEVKARDEQVSAEAALAMTVEQVRKEAVALVKARADDPNVKAIRLRTVNTDNLRNIALALHHFHDAHKDLPPRAISDKAGKPLLSWRVAILPYLEQDPLYREFKLDEPWDSPHNIKLLDKIPEIYAPVGVEAKKGHTFYQGFDGKGSMFETTLDAKNRFGGRGQRLSNIVDGTANTLMVVEAGTSVPWTKPEDVPFDATGKMAFPPLGGISKEGFLGVYGDASVEFHRFPIDAAYLRGLIHRADGVGRLFKNGKEQPKEKLP